jgi:hypothetical protein
MIYLRKENPLVILFRHDLKSLLDAHERATVMESLMAIAEHFQAYAQYFRANKIISPTYRDQSQNPLGAFVVLPAYASVNGARGAHGRGHKSNCSKPFSPSFTIEADVELLPLVPAAASANWDAAFTVECRLRKPAGGSGSSSARCGKSRSFTTQ